MHNYDRLIQIHFFKEKEECESKENIYKNNEKLALPEERLMLPEGVAKADFYVKPNGDVIPAIGYRYMDSKYAEQTLATKNAPGLYFEFEKWIQQQRFKMHFKLLLNEIIVN